MNMHLINTSPTYCKYNKINQTKLAEILLVIDVGYNTELTNKNSSTVGNRHAYYWCSGAGGPTAMGEGSCDCNQPRANAGFPHNDMSNVLFCDFHVGHISWQGEPGAANAGDGFLMW